MKEQTVKDLVKVVRESTESINALDYGRYDENAHTEFLAAILRHRKGLFVRSFLAELLDVAEEEIPSEKYSVSTQVTIKTGRRPDLVIESDSLYVVIENKVCCAGDGGEQLHDYWIQAQDKTRSTARKPYLVYLTLAGGTPAVWSIDEEERREIGEAGFYHERSYKHNVIEWLEQRVLPNCLNSETCLVASLKVYLEYLVRKTGGFARRELAEMLKRVLVKHEGESERDMYAYVVGQQSVPLPDTTERDDAELLAEALETIRQDLVNDDVFLDQSETAYNLKWILKNNPTLRYKNMGHFDVGAFSSVGQFTYCGAKYVQCVTSGRHPDVRIHIPCSREGIAAGLYVFSDEILQYGGAAVRGALEANGFVDEQNIFRLKPTIVPKDLIELARSVEAAIRRIESAVPQLAK